MKDKADQKNAATILHPFIISIGLHLEQASGSPHGPLQGDERAARAPHLTTCAEPVDYEAFIVTIVTSRGTNV